MGRSPMVPDGSASADQINRPERPGLKNHITWMDRHDSLSEVVHSLLHRIEDLEGRVSKLEGLGEHQSNE